MRVVTSSGRVGPIQYAEIIPGKSIRVYGIERRYVRSACDTRMKAFDQSFLIGDIAVYDSYNMSYMSEITSITAKTVSFSKEHKRLKIDEFAWRNKETRASKSTRNAAWTD